MIFKMTISELGLLVVNPEVDFVFLLPTYESTTQNNLTVADDAGPECLLTVQI